MKLLPSQSEDSPSALSYPGWENDEKCLYFNLVIERLRIFTLVVCTEFDHWSMWSRHVGCSALEYDRGLVSSCSRGQCFACIASLANPHPVFSGKLLHTVDKRSIQTPKTRATEYDPAVAPPAQQDTGVRKDDSMKSSLLDTRVAIRSLCY